MVIVKKIQDFVYKFLSKEIKRNLEFLLESHFIKDKQNLKGSIVSEYFDDGLKKMIIWLNLAMKIIMVKEYYQNTTVMV